MKKNLLVAILIASTVSDVLWAGTMGDMTLSAPWSSLVTLTLGPDFVNKSDAQTLTLLPPFQNHYTSTGNDQAILDGGVFLGLEHAISNRLTGQIGIAGYLTSPQTLQGHIWQFALPIFDNFTYSYKVYHPRLMISGKLLTNLDKLQDVHPYISGELGSAFNQASSYQELPLVSNEPPMVPFANHNNVSFAYGVGFGVDYNLNQHVRLGLGYQFSDLGSASLGQTAAAITPETLNALHMYASQLRFQLTVLI